MKTNVLLNVVIGLVILFSFIGEINKHNFDAAAWAFCAFVWFICAVISEISFENMKKYTQQLHQHYYNKNIQS